MRPVQIRIILLNANTEIFLENPGCRAAPENRNQLFTHRAKVCLRKAFMDKAKEPGQRNSLDEQSPGERCYQCNPG